LYVARDQWSRPDPGDPSPCYRQGDLVRLIWATVKLEPPDAKVTGFKVELRNEVVALLSADCDLVDRTPPKRKGVLVSPLRPVPKNIARDPEKMRALTSPTVQSEPGLPIPANQFYFEPPSVSGKEDPLGGGVVFLEVMSTLTFSDLKAAVKLAELTQASRRDFQERIKFHFTWAEGA